MLVVLLLVLLISAMVGYLFILPSLGPQDVDLRTYAASAAARVGAVVLSAAVLAPPITGVVLATRALRLGGGSRAWVGLVLNVLALFLMVAVTIEQIRTAYFPASTFALPG